MAQFAPCKQCSKREVPVVQGRLVEHVDARENPCTGSYGVIRPRDITDDGGLTGIPVKEHAMGASSLGYTVQPPLDENAKPYPGIEVRGDGHNLYGTTHDAAPPAERRVQRGPDGSLYAFPENRIDPVRLEDDRVCGEVDTVNAVRSICVQAKGPHEHVWWPYVEPTGPRLRPEAEVMEIAESLEQPTQPTKTREGDQPLPDGDESYPDIQSLVLADITQRRFVGIQRYGQALQMFNGRDSLQDLYEELIDATVYTRGLMEIRNAHRDRLVEVATSALQGALERDGIAPGDLIAFTEEATEKVAITIVDRLLDYFTAGKSGP